MGVRTACKMSINDDIDNKKNKKEIKYKYKILNAKTFNKLMSWSLKNLDRVFDHILKNEKVIKKENITFKMPNTSTKWKLIEHSIKSFLKSILIFMNGINDVEILRFIMIHVYIFIFHLYNL